uniref:Protein preY, mitochondrial n=1 Tax=Oncorhynchus mykiss TaxID=8022 RepID=C1BIF9_ONCMY|nr:preY, mitochondrial precursor [Oncorhynchus mykiss]
MFQNALRRLCNETLRFQTSVKYVNFLRGVRPLPVSARHLTDVKDALPFDTSLLEFLVCPLSKKQLRYEEKTDELINEELRIAYPIIDGIPNMIPTDARLIKNDPETPVEPA